VVAFFIELLVHNHVPSAKMRRLFFLGKLTAVHIFDATNNIWASLINGGRLCIIDASILISLQLVSSCRFRLRFFPLVLLLLFHELLKCAFDLDLTSLTLLRHGLGTLLQEMECSSLLLCTQVKRVFVD
jgi:hypothetical protein